MLYRPFWAAMFSLVAVAAPPPASDLAYPFPAKPEIYHEGWTDLNKNGVKDVYEDPTQSSTVIWS